MFPLHVVCPSPSGPSDWWTSLAGAVVGAVIAGLVGWLVMGRQIREQRTARGKDVLRDTVSSFWAAADARWRAQQQFDFANYDVTIGQWGDGTRQAGWDRRTEALRAMQTADSQAAHQIALLRLAESPLVDEATDLLERSRIAHINIQTGEDRPEVGAKRKAALEAFEEKARTLLS